MKSFVTVKDRKAMASGRSLRALALALMLCLAVVLSGGCSGMGETRAEAKRRHSRVLRLNTGQLGSDVDMVLMLDKPSMLTDKRLP